MLNIVKFLAETPFNLFDFAAGSASYMRGYSKGLDRGYDMGKTDGFFLGLVLGAALAGLIATAFFLTSAAHQKPGATHEQSAASPTDPGSGRPGASGR